MGNRLPPAHCPPIPVCCPVSHAPNPASFGIHRASSAACPASANPCQTYQAWCLTVSYCFGKPLLAIQPFLFVEQLECICFISAFPICWTARTPLLHIQPFHSVEQPEHPCSLSSLSFCWTASAAKCINSPALEWQLLKGLVVCCHSFCLFLP